MYGAKAEGSEWKNRWLFSMMNVSNNKIVLSLGAHPDDAEIMCAGTIALLH